MGGVWIFSKTTQYIKFVNYHNYLGVIMLLSCVFSLMIEKLSLGHMTRLLR